MDLTRGPQRDFIHLILEMLARRHRDNAWLFGPSGEISLVTNQTDRAVQVPKTSVITFGVHQGIYVLLLKTLDSRMRNLPRVIL